jgi:NADH:ubiquinone oxidoreductase subunit 6 (subunit J)
MTFISFGALSVIIFFLISIYILFLSFGLLTFENPIYAIFLLVLVFFGSSFLLIELNLFFLALMILIVYLGALIVLFLFVVMMLNIKSLELNRVINFFPFIFIFFSAFLLIFLSKGLYFSSFDYNLALCYVFYFDWQHVHYFLGSLIGMGFFLYTFGSIFLIIISIILLLAMLGAIILTLTPSRYFYKQTSINQILQLRVLENIDLK